MEASLVEEDLRSESGSSGYTAEPKKVYHHMRMLRVARDDLLQHPHCLASLSCLVCLLVSFFILYIWWLLAKPATEVHYWPQVVQNKFEKVGCFALLPGDNTIVNDYWDYRCMTNSPSGKTCRSGLPFYSFTKVGRNIIGWKLCASFCLLKGFDLSGVVQSTICRCGATLRNTYVWNNAKGATNRADLHPQPFAQAVDQNSPNCTIVVSRYVGSMPIPEQQLDMTQKDISYVDSIIYGQKIGMEQEMSARMYTVPVLNLSSTVAGQRLLDDIPYTQEWLVNTTFGAELRKMQDLAYRECFPHQCSAGLPWPIKSTYLVGIPFAFAKNVPEDTRKAFRAATVAYSAATCISFTEVHPDYSKELKIMVKFIEGDCSTYPIGYPILLGKDTEMNLGWCNSMLHVGNMIHELGHAVGMDHEHKRADRDKYVKVNNISSLTPVAQAQFSKDNSAFMGVANKKVPYDYGSLMHYPPSKEMHSLPEVNGKGVHDSEMGQRQGFSNFDIEQLRDMYMCDEEVGRECIDLDDELGVVVKVRGVPATCAQVSVHCQGSFGKIISYFCRATCNNCPKQLQRREHGVEGCKDANMFCAKYKEFCPSLESRPESLRRGNEEWMAENCRKTCRIPKFCAGEVVSNATGTEDLGITGEGGLTCVDDAATNLVDLNGAAMSCEMLREKCRDAEMGASVRAKCPATCGICQDDFQIEAHSNPMPSEMWMLATFAILNEGFNLNDEKQLTEFRDAVLPIIGKIWWTSTTYIVAAKEACADPCYEGTFKIITLCCEHFVKGCKNECETVHEYFLKTSPEKLNAKFSQAGSASIDVQNVEIKTTMNTVLNSVFAYPERITALACVGAGMAICLCYALTHVRCCKDEHEKKMIRSLHRDLTRDSFSTQPSQRLIS